MFLKFRYGDEKVLGTQPHLTCWSPLFMFQILISSKGFPIDYSTHTHTHIHWAYPNMHLTLNMASQSYRIYGTNPIIHLTWHLHSNIQRQQVYHKAATLTRHWSSIHNHSSIASWHQPISCSSSNLNACSYNYAWLTLLTSLHHSTYASMHVCVLMHVHLVHPRHVNPNYQTNKLNI